MTRTNFGESLSKNMDTYGFYLQRLCELSLSMFDWQNLPDSIDARFLEMTLFYNGAAVFFEDEDLTPDTITGREGTFLALPVMLNGKWDVYNTPINRRAYATNGYQKDLTNTDSVIIYNNAIRTNSVQTCTMFAERLYNLDRIIDVNANAQKTPVLLQGTEAQRLTLLNLYQKWDGNEPVIFGDKNLDINSIKAISTQAPYVADKIDVLKREIWNDALTYLGISNVNIDKKERLLTDEITRNMGGTIANRYSRLDARREAAEQINKMFGLSIEVYFKSESDSTPSEEPPEETEEEGAEIE